MGRIKLTPKRKLLSLLAGFTIIASTALAFFAAEVIFEGSGTEPAGQASSTIETLLVRGWSGIKPGEARPITVEPNNTTTGTVTVKTAAFTVTTGTAGCEPSWFSVVGTGTEGANLLAGTGKLAIPVGTIVVTGDFSLQFREEPSINQNACQKANITVKGTLH